MSEELNKKFKKIYNKSKRIDLKKVDIVYTSIKENQEETKDSSTISEIAKDTRLKKSTVTTYIKHLNNASYIKKNRKYTPPFLKVTTKTSEVNFIYGKDKRDTEVRFESQKLLNDIKTINNNILNPIKSQIILIKNSKDYNSKFLTAYNQIIEHLWKNKVGLGLVKLEIGSGANRYFIY